MSIPEPLGVLLQQAMMDTLQKYLGLNPACTVP